MFFKCRVCEEKDKRIQDLHLQIRDLRQLSMPDTSKLSLVAIESDAVLSGHEEQISISMTEEEAELTQREQDRILSGTYDVT